MLSEALEPTPVRLHAFPKLEFCGTRAGHKSRVFEQRLDHVDAVVDRTLEVVQMVGRRAAQDDRRRPRLFCPWIVPRFVLAQLPEDGDTVAADFGRLKDVDVAGFFGRRCADACQGRGVDDAADSAEIEFGKDFEDGDVESIEVMESEFADGGPGDDDFDTRIRNLLEDLVYQAG